MGMRPDLQRISISGIQPLQGTVTDEKLPPMIQRMPLFTCQVARFGKDSTRIRAHCSCVQRLH